MTQTHDQREPRDTEQPTPEPGTEQNRSPRRRRRGGRGRGTPEQGQAAAQSTQGQPTQGREADHADARPSWQALLGDRTPTPVQAQAVPAALAGRDLMASAQTGSGKTAAFLLPALQKMIRRSDKPGKGPRVLVLTPTRELAMQVEKNAQLYAQNMKWLRSATLVGGAGFGFQIKALSRPIDLIVATPGRLMDHMRAGRIEAFGPRDEILDKISARPVPLRAAAGAAKTGAAPVAVAKGA